MLKGKIREAPFVKVQFGKITVCYRKRSILKQNSAHKEHFLLFRQIFQIDNIRKCLFIYENWAKCPIKPDQMNDTNFKKSMCLVN